MIPARKSKKSNSKFYIRILVVVFLGIVAFLFSKWQSGVWDGKNKVSLVTQNNESVHVITFDPKLELITNIKIPGSTEVEVSRGLGTWKVGNVWKLAENEGLTRELVSGTITKNFKFPVFLWGDPTIFGFAEGSLGSVLKAMIFKYETNLGFLDKIKIGLFALGVKQGSRINIDLADSAILQKTKLKDGEEGYAISGKSSEKLWSIFSDNEVTQSNLKLVIRDSAGMPKVAEEVAKVIEVLGPKVTSITKEEKGGFDCFISGKVASFTKRVSRILNCSLSDEFSLGNFDLEIKIGEKFAERF